MHSAAMAWRICPRRLEGTWTIAAARLMDDGRRCKTLSPSLSRLTDETRDKRRIKSGAALLPLSHPVLPPLTNTRKEFRDVMRAATTGLPVRSQTSSVDRKQFVPIHPRRPHWMLMRPAVGRPMQGSACQQPLHHSLHTHMHMFNMKGKKQPVLLGLETSHKCWELNGTTSVGNAGGGSLIIRLFYTTKLRSHSCVRFAFHER